MSATLALVTALGPIGLVEVVEICTMAGTSLDYALHMGTAFAAAPAGLSDAEKARHAVLEMGSAVLGAAVTTAGCASFLFFAALTPLRSLGIFFAANATLGVAYTLVFLVPLLAGLGGGGQSGGGGGEGGAAAGSVEYAEVEMAAVGGGRDELLL